jgi:hypothetical protein
MICIEAPNYTTAPEFRIRSLFLAGGITGCPEWQTEMIQHLQETNLYIYNPRRTNFPIHDPTAAVAQIAWEHHHLKRAHAISFWFCKETIQPIVLFELGKWYQHKKIFIGMDPEYPRRQDVEIQTQLDRSIPIAYRLEDLAQQIIQWAQVYT